MVLSTVTVADTLRINDRIVRSTTKPLTDPVRVTDSSRRTVTKVLVDALRIREIRFFSPVSLVISEAIKVVEEMTSEMETIFRYISRHLGRGIRMKRAGDETTAEV